MDDKKAKKIYLKFTSGYVIHVYSSYMFESLTKKDNLGCDRPNWTFIAENKKQVVGLMKIIIDNFDPAHIDIMSVKDFYAGDEKVQSFIRELERSLIKKECVIL